MVPRNNATSSIAGETGNSVRTEAGLYGRRRYSQVTVATLCSVACCYREVMILKMCITFTVAIVFAVLK